MASTNLSRLLNPKSVCYVGGSQISGPIRAAKRAGYEGQIWIVNPVRDEIEGVKCYPTLDDLPSPPDAAVVGLSPDRSIDVVAALSKAGAGGAVVMSSGFLELGSDQGRIRQEQLIEAAGDMPLLGPNCMGLINQFSGAAVWGDDNHMERQDGKAAAIISQSGALLIGMTNVEQAFPLGFGVSLGNQAVTTSAELIEAFVDDERIAAIGLYVEGMNNGDAFGQACLKALKKGVPVIALKGGDGNEGSKVSLSHTASMVVERDIWEAFCQRFGIVEVSSPKALVETLKLLTVGGVPSGNRVSIISYSGGLNGLAATRASKTGLQLHMPTDANLKFMRDLLPETVALNNPLDLNIPFSASDGSISMRDTKGVADAIIAFAENVSDQIVFFIDVPLPGAAGLDKVWCDSMEALIEVREKLKIPVSVAGILPQGLGVDFRRHMHSNGVAALLGFSETMEALAVSAQISKFHNELANSRDIINLVQIPELHNHRMLNEAESKSSLAEFGLQTSRFKIASPDEAAECAVQLGFPVALKVLSETIAHKAKVGGVRLNLNSREEVDEACRQMVLDVKQAEGGHEVKTVLVEKMISCSDREIIVGIKRHSSMGLSLMVGKGGGSVEEIAEFYTLLLPLVDEELDSALKKLHLASHPALESLKRACGSIAAFAIANKDRLATLDVNPVILTRSGETIAADALIVIGESVHDT